MIKPIEQTVETIRDCARPYQELDFVNQVLDMVSCYADLNTSPSIWIRPVSSKVGGGEGFIDVRNALMLYGAYEQNDYDAYTDWLQAKNGTFTNVGMTKAFLKFLDDRFEIQNRIGDSDLMGVVDI